LNFYENIKANCLEIDSTGEKLYVGKDDGSIVEFDTKT